MRIGNQAAILTLSRLANYGLMLLSPLILVRLMPIADFGRYREFLLYAALLYGVAGFSIYEGLLYLIPSHPQSPWRMVRQSILLTACSSTIVVALLIVLEFLTGHALVGHYLLPLSLYLLFLTNVDFWEFFLIATRRPAMVLVYTAVRLTARMAVSVIVAAVVGDVDAIVWSLVAVEAVRLVVSVIVWRVKDKSASEPVVPLAWRAQLRFCLPTGTTLLLALARRNLSTIAVAKLLGPVSLAQFAIGKYGEPVVTTVRNSLTAVILPEMVRRQERQPQSSLALWKKATVINAIMLFPVAVLVARYADPLIDVAFGAAYHPAALVMQLYMLVVIRECFDFSPLVRSAGKTSGLIYASLLGLLSGAVALWFLIPAAGIAGAMGAFVIASWVEAVCLAVVACRLSKVSVAELVPWSGIGRIALAATVSCVVLVDSFWTRAFGPLGVVLGSACYLALFAGLLALLRVAEAFVLFDWVRRSSGFARAELRG